MAQTRRQRRLPRRQVPPADAKQGPHGRGAPVGKRAAACIIVPAFNAGETSFKHWQDLAWHLDEKLDHNGIAFFKQDFAFNVGWATDGDPTIYSTRADGPKTLRKTKRSKEEQLAARENPHPQTRQGGLV